VRTVAYHYTFGESGGNEILSYEEHPNPSIRRRAGAFEVREGTPADRPYHLGGHRT
jgi:hypothetical protein